jgi:hypothetical protein
MDISGSIRVEVTVNPGWDEPPLDIQVPDDARELDRDVLAYHRELRARRRRMRLRRLTSPFAGQGTILPLLASILAVCLVAGAMLSVATFNPATGSGAHPTAPASSSAVAPPRLITGTASAAASSTHPVRSSRPTGSLHGTRGSGTPTDH